MTVYEIMSAFDVCYDVALMLFPRINAEYSEELRQAELDEDNRKDYIYVSYLNDDSCPF